MSRVLMVVVDVSDIRKRLDSWSTTEFDPAVYESWMGRVYCKAHAIPCVSATLLDYLPHDFSSKMVELTSVAKTLRIDPLRILPHPRELDRSIRGLSFCLNGGILLMGDGRVIENARRDMRTRLPRHSFLDIA